MLIPTECGSVEHGRVVGARPGCRAKRRPAIDRVISKQLDRLAQLLAK
jgi:hypothetical protein